MHAATLRTCTLGCKVNQYETEFVRQGLLGIGYRDADDDEPADLCIVNTCTVTSQGDAKSRQLIRQMARRNPAARIVVMGCYAAREPQTLAELPNVYEVVQDRRELPDLLSRFGVREVPTGIDGFANGRHRAFVKVQDGCLLNCSFCIIPQVRPGMSSRPAEHILDEVRRLVDQGYREIVLAGIHLGHYGVDFNRGKPKSEWLRLSHLLSNLMEIDAPFRVRLSSIEGTEVTRELLEVMAAHPRRICPHLHISMQSGSDAVLRRMRRRWGAQRFVDRCRLAHEMLDQPAITTDIIVGFPGETEDDFQETCRVSKAVGFSKIHIFPFSPRPGTDAAGYAGQVDPQVKQERVARLTACEAELRQQYFRSLLGRDLEVMVEQPLASSPGRFSGTACRYAPVAFEPGSAATGDLVRVRAEQTDGDMLFGSTAVTAVVGGTE